MIDPIVEEVRNWRMEHTRKFDGNLKLICDDLRRIQSRTDGNVVSRPPRLLRPNVGDEVPARIGRSG